MVTRILFLGTPAFAVPSLERLIGCQPSQGWKVIGAVTQPDRPAGRGRKMSLPAAKQAALKSDIPVFQPERIRGNPEAMSLLDQLQPDLIVVVAFGQILPRDFFDFPRYGTLNVHASLLPAYRGAAPVVHAIWNGDEQTGVTIMKIDEGMDTGDILAQRACPIPPEMTAGELEEQLAEQGAELLIEVLPDYLAGTVKPRPQGSEGATYSPRITPQDAIINWGASARKVHDQIRAFNPRPGARTTFRGEALKIWKSRFPKAAKKDFSLKPGTIAAIDPAVVAVACGGGECVELIEFQLPNRNRIDAQDFTNGAQLRVGERFSD